MRNVAILVDGSFYLKQHRKYFKQNDAKQVAKDLVNHCVKHVYNANQGKNNKGYDREQERLYRIFFYDCPPIDKKIRHPLTDKDIDLSKSDITLFRNDLHNQLKQTRNLALRLGELDSKHARWKIKILKKKNNLLREN